MIDMSSEVLLLIQAHAEKMSRDGKTVNGADFIDELESTAVHISNLYWRCLQGLGVDEKEILSSLAKMHKSVVTKYEKERR